MDKLGGNPNARHSAVLALNDVSARYDLIDIWRLRHRHEHNFTWAGKDPADTSLMIRTRIDFFLTSRNFDRFVTSVDILPYSHSDHDCICLTFDFEHLARGPGYWYFNNEVLKDEVFEAEIERF